MPESHSDFSRVAMNNPPTSVAIHREEVPYLFGGLINEGLGIGVGAIPVYEVQVQAERRCGHDHDHECVPEELIISFPAAIWVTIASAVMHTATDLDNDLVVRATDLLAEFYKRQGGDGDEPPFVPPV